MKKLFRWFALALLVGAMVFATWGASVDAKDEDAIVICGHAKVTPFNVTILQDCSRPCGWLGGGPDVTVGSTHVDVFACLE
jgi:hypothetical protein